MRHQHLSSFEIGKKLRECHKRKVKTLAFLPVGCTEQHGPFLPVECDSLAAEALAWDIVGRLTRKVLWGYVFPSIPFSPTRSNASYPGTVSVSEDVFRIYIRDICTTLLHSEFDAVVIICGHGPADPSLKEIAFGLVDLQFRASGQTIKPVWVGSIAAVSSSLITKSGQKPGKHADWREFLMLHKVLGSEYFTSDLMARYKKFSRKKCFSIPFPQWGVCGIPLEYRSMEGVIGSPLPLGEDDIDKAAEEYWNRLVENVAKKMEKELSEFWKLGPVKKRTK